MQDKQLLKNSVRRSSIIGIVGALIFILSSPILYVVFQNKYDKVAIVHKQDIHYMKSLNNKELNSVIYRLEASKDFFQYLIKVIVFIQFFTGIYILQIYLLKLKLHKKLKEETITSTRNE